MALNVLYYFMENCQTEADGNDFWYNVSREYSAPENYPFVHLYRQPECSRKSVLHNAFVIVRKLPYLSKSC